MSNVISLSAYRSQQVISDTPKVAVTLDLDVTQIKRIYSLDAKGAPSFTLDNPLELGPRAYAQIHALFWHYGLRQMPTTWGELEGNWRYCRLLSLWMTAMTPEEPKSVLNGLRARHNENEPGRGDLLFLLMTGDLDGAHAWHTERDTFRRNSVDPKLAHNKHPVAST